MELARTVSRENTLSEIEMYATVMRAISKFKAVYDDVSPQMRQFGKDARERFGVA
ncbi:hypothetical protein [Bradyrhizobium sp. USDA 223]|uniref:hypothetical protein n=1 Tax=Bradyrhizobium sp. USDA 223 TaxID=3156306 RepID=UPI003833DAA2